MKPLEFRARARQHADKARVILDNPTDADVPYAALELRKAIEAIAYERMLSYRNDISNEKLKTWQPHKVLDIVAAIDPGTRYKVVISAELVDGSGEFTPLFAETPLNNNTVRKYYHALGSYLHMPTVKQIEDGNDHNLSSARTLCDAVLASIQDVINVENWVISKNFPLEFGCMRSGCNTKILRNAASLLTPHADHPSGSLKVECFECEATYSVSFNGESFSIEPEMSRVKCEHLNCGRELQIWHADARRALRENKQSIVTCDDCGGSSQVVLGLLTLRQG
jgi:hypothetical protein